MKFTVVASVAAAAAVASAQYNSTVTAHPTNTHIATSVITKTITSCSDNKCHAVATVVPADNSTTSAVPKVSGNSTVSPSQTKVATGAAAHVAGSMLGAVAVGAVALLI
ncbi:hypothetical protein D0Z00_002364 [Geotrichum galactomycetum]|uniref:Uncharacterized protein n=1 Tax=Geotrichum galactomycetum TaxID=27317 RepID=A0ACB6V4D7_9ASCO|nr:hypothetical protein D0Z00_002364 [Geotrichum candidum]